MAFDLDTGKLAWSSQSVKGDAYNIDCDIPGDKQANCPQAKGPDFDFGSSAILVDLPNGHRALIAGAKSGIVYAVDPDAARQAAVAKTRGTRRMSRRRAVGIGGRREEHLCGRVRRAEARGAAGIGGGAGLRIRRAV